jgi:hypothetical protein
MRDEGDENDGHHRHEVVRLVDRRMDGWMDIWNGGS